MVGRLIQLLILVLLSPSNGALQAQESPVRLKMEPLSLRTRSSGPIGMQVKLEYNQTTILEGDLVLEVFDGLRSSNMLLTTIRYEDIVLQGSDFIFNMLLPPLPPTGSPSYEVEAWFETKTERFALSASTQYKDPPDTFTVFGNTTVSRGIVLCSTSGRADPSRFSDRRTRLHELFSTAALVPQKYAQNVVYFPSGRGGISMPENPLDLCCYDAVLLTDGALKQLDPGQLEAIASWTEAGGSLCVAPTDLGHSKRHLKFLRRLLPRHVSRLQLSEDGRITFTTDGALYCADYSGLGRCVLMSDEFDKSTRFSVIERNGLRGFFWKARGSAMPAPGDAFLSVVPHWKHNRIEPQDAAGMQGSVYDLGNPVMWEHIEGMMSPVQGRFSQIWQSVLMPSDVRMVPTSVIAGLLLAYVLAVGPADYWFLGLLRRRKYTWILFPLVTLAFTMGMVSVAHHYLGSNETGGRVVVTDVGTGGRLIRETVLEQLFVGSRREAATEVTAGLVSAVHQKPLFLNGRFPQKYTADRRVEQWTPEMLRTMTLSPQPIPNLPVDWDDTELITTKVGRERLGVALAGDASTDCVFAYVFHGSLVLPVQRARRTATHYVHPQTRSQQGLTVESLEGALHDALGAGTQARPAGFLQYVSQISPSGDSVLEDLPIHDIDNPDQWVLAILLKTDDGYHAIRRLYHLTESDN